MKDGIEFIRENHDLIYLTLILAILLVEKFLGETDKVRASNLIDLVINLLTKLLNGKTNLKGEENGQSIRSERLGEEAARKPEADGGADKQSHP